MLRIVSIFILLACSAYSYAASVDSTTKILSLSTYGTYSTSDTRYRNEIVIEVAGPAVGCDDGFYIIADDVESNPTMVSFLLSAFHSDSNVRFAAYNDQLRAGSKKYCRVINIKLVK